MTLKTFIFVLLIASLSFLSATSDAVEPVGRPAWVRLVFLDMTDYRFYKEVYEAVGKSGPVSTMIPRAASRGFYEFDIMATSKPSVLKEELALALVEKAVVELKVLSIGIPEITISPK